MTAPGVIWIASYPRSGSTWLRSLIVSLCRDGAAPDINALLHDCPFSANRHWLEDVTGVSVADLTAEECKQLRCTAHLAVARQTPLARLAAPATRFIKVHDCYDAALFPAAATAGAVYVVRDPRDVALSLAAFFGWPLDRAIRHMGETDFHYPRNPATVADTVEEILGSWSQNVASWLDGFAGPLLAIRYEDLKADPATQVCKLARFIAAPDDAATVNAAIAATGFARLQHAEETSGFVESGTRPSRFFRRGEAGAWRDELSGDQAARLAADHGVLMRRLGYSPDGGVQTIS